MPIRINDAVKGSPCSKENGWTSTYTLYHVTKGDGQSVRQGGTPRLRKLTVKESAAALGVSEKTIRRRIQSGEIPAELIPGPYGDQYAIPEEAINTAQHVLEVVQVERPTDPRTLALAIGQAVEDVVSRRTAALESEIKALREQLSEVVAALDSPGVDQSILQTAKENAVQAKLTAFEAVEAIREEKITAAARERRLLEALERLREERRPRPWWRIWR